MATYRVYPSSHLLEFPVLRMVVYIFSCCCVVCINVTTVYGFMLILQPPYYKDLQLSLDQFIQKLVHDHVHGSFAENFASWLVDILITLLLGLTVSIVPPIVILLVLLFSEGLVLLQMFYFFSDREISEMRGPTGLKFCGMVSTRPNFIMPVQNFGGRTPKKFQGRKTCKIWPDFGRL